MLLVLQLYYAAISVLAPIECGQISMKNLNLSSFTSNEYLVITKTRFFAIRGSKHRCEG